MDADEIVKVLQHAERHPEFETVAVMLSLAEALCCDECGGTGQGLWLEKDSTRKPCSSCGQIRDAVRRWKEGRNA